METARDASFDVDREKYMLKYKLNLLEKFMRSHEREPHDPIDECRLLQYKIECIQSTTAVVYMAEEILSFYEQQRSSGPDGFTEWMAQRNDGLYHHQLGAFVRPPATLCCHHKDCINYIYGFHRFENLESHLKEHHTMKRESFDATSKASLPIRNPPDDETEDRDLKYIPFDPTSPKRKREGECLPNPAKRILDKANMKLVKDQGACLRCKILKKKCDDRNPCSHCPLQDSDGKGDHWKVLGCHRSPLKELSKVLLRKHLAQPVRYFKDGEGLQKSIDLSDSGNNLSPESLDSASTSTAAQSSLGLYSAGDENNSEEAQKAQKTAVQKFTSNWRSTARGLLTVAESHYEVSVRTAYSPLDLMRCSRKMCEDPKWQDDLKIELDLVHEIISEAIEFYVFERRLLDQMPTAGNLSLENHTPDETNLRKFLEAFSNSCSRRNSLPAQAWVVLFHSLCLFSIYKTILIDAYALRAQYESSRTWRQSDAIAIDSVYRTLVSIFTWASRVKDPMLSEDYDLEDANIHEALKETREMVKYDMWKVRGIKSSKDFLMNLGSGICADGTFNGFVLQTYRLKRRLEQSQQLRKRADRMSLDGRENDTCTLEYSKPPKTKSQPPPSSKSTALVPDAATPNRDLNTNPNANPTSIQPGLPTTKAIILKQWLGELSTPAISSMNPDQPHLSNWLSSNRTPSNSNMFGYRIETNQLSNPAAQLGGTHTESWLENNSDTVQAASSPRAPFSLIFEDEE